MPVPCINFGEIIMKRFLLIPLLALLTSVAVAQPLPQYRGTLKLGESAEVGKIHLMKLPVQTLTVTNNDAQNNTLTVAELVGGITVHTSVTAGGTVTTDTAANIIAGSNGVGVLNENNQCYQHFYVNDGSQTLTFAGGTGVTVSDTGNTILINEAAILLVCRTSSTAVTVHLVTS